MTWRSETELLIRELKQSINMYVLGCSLIYLEYQSELFTLQLLRLLAELFFSAGFTGLAAAGT